jgi:Arc-like DNA binding domain
MAPTDELRPVMTRLPERLRRRLERAAAANQRSMNAEIIHRLELSFGGGPLVGAEGLFLMEERMRERHAEVLRALHQLKRAENGEEKS